MVIYMVYQFRIYLFTLTVFSGKRNNNVCLASGLSSMLKSPLLTAYLIFYDCKCLIIHYG
ncbi:hypothetical protein YY29_004674 [Salmonella enterica subsp. enterica]|nr:hypothetical protein [Salmonella enterica subsp. enterica serovar Tanger]EDV9437480.1 hypothetical protein [Salmonella enterica subsp. enterica]